MRPTDAYFSSLWMRDAKRIRRLAINCPGGFADALRSQPKWLVWMAAMRAAEFRLLYREFPHLVPSVHEWAAWAATATARDYTPVMLDLELEMLVPRDVQEYLTLAILALRVGMEQAFTTFFRAAGAQNAVRQDGTLWRRLARVRPVELGRCAVALVRFKGAASELETWLFSLSLEMGMLVAENAATVLDLIRASPRQPHASVLIRSVELVSPPASSVLEVVRALAHDAFAGPWLARLVLVCTLTRARAPFEVQDMCVLLRAAELVAGHAATMSDRGNAEAVVRSTRVLHGVEEASVLAQILATLMHQADRLDFAKAVGRHFWPKPWFEAMNALAGSALPTVALDAIAANSLVPISRWRK